MDSKTRNEPSVEVLRVLCDTTVRLTEIRQRGCAHLSVEDFAPECLRNLIAACTQNAGRGNRR